MHTPSSSSQACQNKVQPRFFLVHPILVVFVDLSAYLLIQVSHQSQNHPYIHIMRVKCSETLMAHRIPKRLPALRTTIYGSMNLTRNCHPFRAKAPPQRILTEIQHTTRHNPLHQGREHLNFMNMSRKKKFHLGLGQFFSVADAPRSCACAKSVAFQYRQTQRRLCSQITSYAKSLPKNCKCPKVHRKSFLAWILKAWTW